MGEWDEVCILCGLRPGFPPPFIAYNRTKLEELPKWIDEIRQLLPTDKLQLTPDDLFTFLSDAMDEYHQSAYDEHINMPRLQALFGTWRYFHTAISVGYFEKDEYFGREIMWSTDWPEKLSFPNGRHVQVRRVKIVWSGDPQLRLYHPIEEDTGSDDDDSDREKGAKEELTPCSAQGKSRSPNFYILEGPFYYLKSWLDLESMPPRSFMFPDEIEPMSFEGELYEVINSRKDRRDEYTSFLPYIDYGELRKSVDQFQDVFVRTRNSAVHTANTIKAGSKGEDLILAMLEDCQAHLFARPDVWPIPPNTDDAISPKKLLSREPKEPTTAFFTLPVELFIKIFSLAPLSDTFAVAATCKKANFRITPLIETIIRTSVLSDTNDTSMKWVLPVPAIPGETDRAFEVARKWLDAATKTDLTPLSSSMDNPFQHPSFPYLAFMKACYEPSAWSMKNRRRLWGMVKQFEEIWRNYRTKGNEVNYFTDDFGPGSIKA